MEKNTFKSPTEGSQHLVFDYSTSDNNKNVFVENVKNLSQYIAVSGSVIHDAPIVVYIVRKFTALVFEVPENTEKDYEGGYNKLKLRGYLDNSKELEQNKKTWTTNNQVV